MLVLPCEVQGRMHRRELIDSTCELLRKASDECSSNENLCREIGALLNSLRKMRGRDAGQQVLELIAKRVPKDQTASSGLTGSFTANRSAVWLDAPMARTFPPGSAGRKPLAFRPGESLDRRCGIGTGRCNPSADA